MAANYILWDDPDEGPCETLHKAFAAWKKTSDAPITKADFDELAKMMDEEHEQFVGAIQNLIGEPTTTLPRQPGESAAAAAARIFDPLIRELQDEP